MHDLHFSVIPAKAGIHLPQMPRDSRFRGSDGGYVFFDTLSCGKALVHCPNGCPASAGMTARREAKRSLPPQG